MRTYGTKAEGPLSRIFCLAAALKPAK